MNQIIKTESLLKILLPLQPIIQDSHVVPILQNVKLEMDKKELYATGNNLEVVCTNSVKHTSKEKVSFCVNYVMLLQIVKSISDKQIVLNISDNHIEITHKKGSFDLPIESAREYPEVEKESFKKKASVKGIALKSALKVANKFILSDDLDAMANISLSIGKKVYVRSTDRNRLFEEKIKGKGDEENILISGKSSLALSALLEEIEDDVEMVYNTNSIFFKFDNKEIMVVQQQGNFPLKMFKQIIETIKDAEPFEINVKDFVTALKRVSIMSSKEKHTTVKLKVEKGRVIIKCESEVAATKGEEEVSVKYDKKAEVGYNFKYLIEILSVFEKEPKLFLDDRKFLFIKQNKKQGGIAPVILNNGKN
jgi:DNA polymerase III sliding clamp (beta) subunit (PCNA family)